MIQEYLLQEISEKEAVSAYNPDGVEKRYFSADNGECWYVQFSIDGNNERIAKQLSDVDEYVQKNYHVTLLEDGCSAYFNVRLYPLISEFEYKLRKLLYLSSAINHDEKSASNISNLDSQDLGQIFTLLFIDTTFMKDVKGEVKALNQEVFSKANVIAAIEAIDEKTLWDDLLGKASVPTLRKRFNDVREYRNDVMHSHHLNWKKYREIILLYKTINSELDEAFYNISVVESKTPSKPTFNQTLNIALRTQEQISALSDALKTNLEEINQLSKLYSQNPTLSETVKRMSEFSSAYAFSPEMQKVQEQVALLSKAYALSPAALELQGQLKELAKIKVEISPAIQSLQALTNDLKIPKIEIPPELLRLQKSLDSFRLNEEKTVAGEENEQTSSSDSEGDDGENDNGNV